jgi:hypothetical protein
MIEPRSSAGGSWTQSISKSSNRVAPRSHTSSACLRLKATRAHEGMADEISCLTRA